MGVRKEENERVFRFTFFNVSRAGPFFSSTSTLILPYLETTHFKPSAERRDGSSGFTSGFILGGVVFGALGYLFAPQISKALLSDDQSRLKLPRFLDDDADGDGRGGASSRQPMTKQDLADRIAQLNSAIDDVSAQLRAQDEAAAAGGVEEGEAVSEVAA